MKNLIFTLAVGLGVQANAGDLFRCQFTSERKEQEPFVMTGHIFASSSEDRTYLTLQPPSSVELPFEARVLITGGEFGGDNPMTIHPRGNTVSIVVHSELHGNGNEIVYVDMKGNRFALKCSKEWSFQATSF